MDILYEMARGYINGPTKKPSKMEAFTYLLGASTAILMEAALVGGTTDPDLLLIESTAVRLTEMMILKVY